MRTDQPAPPDHIDPAQAVACEVAGAGGRVLAEVAGRNRDARL